MIDESYNIIDIDDKVCCDPCYFLKAEIILAVKQLMASRTSDDPAKSLNVCDEHYRLAHIQKNIIIHSVEDINDNTIRTA
jgi:hypothetical protein